jgi:hypothetical protein
VIPPLTYGLIGKVFPPTAPLPLEGEFNRIFLQEKGDIKIQDATPMAPYEDIQASYGALSKY